MISTLKAVCGNVHIWVLVINFVTTAILAGVGYGVLITDISSLRHDLEQDINLQQQWNTEEHQTDNLHRQRTDALENRFFELLLKLQLSH